MKRWIYVGVAVLILAGLIGWRLTQKRAEAADQAKQRQARGQSATVVQVVTATRQDVVKRFEAVGSVEAPFAVDLSPKVSGRLLFLQVREGDRVQAGQVLARIDPAEVEAEVRSKQATLAQAESRLAEAELTRNPTNVGVTAEISRQRAALQTAQAQSRQASADVGAQLGAARSAVTEAAGRVAAAEADIASAEATIRPPRRTSTTPARSWDAKRRWSRKARPRAKTWTTPEPRFRFRRPCWARHGSDGPQPWPRALRPWRKNGPPSSRSLS
jgi:multidrug efflux pump subunit AcrA (membrane-fusion protein)